MDATSREAAIRGEAERIVSGWYWLVGHGEMEVDACVRVVVCMARALRQLSQDGW